MGLAIWQFGSFGSATVSTEPDSIHKLTSPNELEVSGKMNPKLERVANYFAGKSSSITLTQDFLADFKFCTDDELTLTAPISEGDDSKFLEINGISNLKATASKACHFYVLSLEFQSDSSTQIDHVEFLNWANPD